MKKTLLVISLIFGAASTQAFELSKAGTPSILKSSGTMTFNSCATSCSTDPDYIACLQSGPSGLCSIIYNNCVDVCNSAGTGGGTGGGGGGHCPMWPDPCLPQPWH